MKHVSAAICIETTSPRGQPLVRRINSCMTISAKINFSHNLTFRTISDFVFVSIIYGVQGMDCQNCDDSESTGNTILLFLYYISPTPPCSTLL